MFGGVAWQWDSSRLQYYLHNFLPCQPDLNFHCPEVQEAVLRECQFWLERGVDGLRLDTVNFYFQSRGLESNPPIKPEQFNDTTAPAVNPYNFQDHVYDKSQPENLEFLKKLRGLLNQYSGRTSLGEIGDSQRQLELSTLYTTGRDRLHMAYTFDFLGGEFDVDYFVKVISQYSSLSSGWMCNSFSNHDVVRHISRWGRNLAPTERNAFSSLCISLLLCLRGSVCIYQGEELGLTEAELSFEELVDPYGIEFWPKYKGRDGCRTPLPWNGGSHLGGFTSNPKSWLPVPSSHLGSAVNIQEADENSILVHYRKMIAFRRGHPVLCFGSIDVHPLSSATCGVLAFWRATSDEKVLCIFNLCSKASNFRLERHYSIIGLDCPGSKDVVIDDERDITLPAFAYFIGLVDI
jgi:alpha-glucosidase